MIRVHCDRCKLIIDNEKAFKVCEVRDGNIKDTAILCAPCMKVVTLDVIKDEAIDGEGKDGNVKAGDEE